MEFSCAKPGTRINPSFHIIDKHGSCLFATSNLHDAEWSTKNYERGYYRANCAIPANLLNDGQYRVSAFIVTDLKNIVATTEESVTFSVFDDGATKGDYTGPWIGHVRPLLSWHVEEMETTYP
jgi:hypothetical protein